MKLETQQMHSISVVLFGMNEVPVHSLLLLLVLLLSGYLLIESDMSELDVSRPSLHLSSRFGFLCQ